MRRSLLAQVLADPSRLVRLGPHEWDLLLRQARWSDLLPRLAELAPPQSTGPSVVPAAVRPHLEAARALQRAQREDVERELVLLDEVLRPIGAPVLLLKGAAYLLDHAPAALGRTLTDVDILVPREALSAVESALLLAGWHTSHPDPHDQRYYRRWMHELPPMVHGRRGTVLDVHHAILPLTSRLQSDTQALLDASNALPSRPLFRVPCREDQVLHGLTHLLVNEDLRHGLRDLSDADRMLRHLLDQDPQATRLLERARTLGLTAPLRQGWALAHELLDTPLPAPVRHALRARASAANPMGGAIEAVCHHAWRQALDTHHPSVAGAHCAAARALLFVRAHTLRLPLHLLVPHLSVKAWRRLVQPPS